MAGASDSFLQASIDSESILAYIEGMKNIANDTAVRYTVSVTVTRPVQYDNNSDGECPLSEQAEWRLSADAKRELVREVMTVLRKLDGDCDCEVMDAVITEE